MLLSGGGLMMDGLVGLVGDRLVELGVKRLYHGDVFVRINRRKEGLSSCSGVSFVFGAFDGVLSGQYRIVCDHCVDGTPMDNEYYLVDVADPEFDPMDVVWLGYLVHVANNWKGGCDG
jgi:hypothetical protein